MSQNDRPRTAQDFARAAIQYAQAADQMRPGDHDHYSHAMSLIVYHLRAAAGKAREVAEHLAGAETQPKETAGQ